MDRSLTDALEQLIRQSAEVFGADHPSTLALRQQLEAALATEEKAPRVFWIKPVAPDAPAGKD